MKTEVIHTTRKGKSVLVYFPLILNYSVRSIYSHTNSYNNAITQCHVDGTQRAWAACAYTTGILPKNVVYWCQLRHFLVVHPLLKKILDPPLGTLVGSDQQKQRLEETDLRNADRTVGVN